MLTDYNKKRNFSKTSEPKGQTKKSSKKAKIFVIQHHNARAEHYDFRLEHNGILLSWAVPKGLSNNPKVRRLAVHVEDHPVDYATFEGIIPKGNYGAGSVEIEDKGNYMPLEDMDQGLRKGHLKIILSGKKYKGCWSMIKTDDKNWLIIKAKDEFSNEREQPSKKLKKNPFISCSPMLATLSPSLPKGKGWLYEIKYDGYRIIAFKENDNIKLLSRNGVDYSKKFKEIGSSLSLIKHNFVTDGEVVCFDEKGRSDFGLLQENLKKGGNGLSYVVFDLLALNGKDLRQDSLAERKSILEDVLADCKENIVYAMHLEDKGRQCFSFAKKMNLEGVMAKKKNSKYEERRSENWLKIKCYKRQEFVIGGFTTTKQNQLLSALLVGYYNKGKFVFAGKVGTGFNEEIKKSLNRKLKKIARQSSPFENLPSVKENTFFVQPKYIAEVQYSEITKSGVLRQPSFVGLREDKKAIDVVLEEK